MTGAWLLDVGNSRTKLAILEGTVVHPPVSFPHQSGPRRLAKELVGHLQEQEAWPVWVCCSNPAVQAELPSVMGETHPLHVLSKGHIPLQVATEGTGVDRLLATWAAWQMMGTGVIVLDVGTAWTLDVLTRDGTFHGGSIGISPSLQAELLHEVCPHLPMADLQQRSSGSIPTNTLDAVNAGIWQAFAKATEGLKSAWQKEVGQTLIPVLCGGGSQAIRGWLEEGWEWQPDLILQGLAGMVHRHEQA